MSHSHELPSELDLDAIRTLLDWARGKAPFSRSVLEAGYCLLGYALGQVVPAPRLVGSPADPRPVESVAIDALESLVAEQPVSQGLIPWSLIAEWLVSKLLAHLLNESN